ncbi:hypothetical protein Ddye_006326 [Dipteronia dyeriana]|uniref:F-box domain-containing protein n=1 Tax=Dipteronia dyeriana TaxID=168575 RepID=A0AAD9XI84_9ROSI|nr:hypothetical protein Ddye_006326 [Dipteronia dyeriana]
MEGESDLRLWDELIPDALGLIFKNLPLKEVLTVIPRVCKSWSKAVAGPYCWQEIDVEEWSNRCKPDHLDRMLQMLITRSSGSLRKLCVSGLRNNMMFSFIAENAGSLQTLRLTRSEISDSVAEQIAGRLSAITFLDLSYCCKIGATALEAIGKHCKLLAGLCRNMHPLDTADKLSQDDEATVIATTMPKLRRLEMAYSVVSTEGVLNIISSCSKLEFLDLRGCWDVKIDDKFMEGNFPNLKVLGPLVLDYYEINDWDDFSDYSDASEDLAWEILAGEMGDYDDDEMYDGRLDELELRFYDGIDADAGIYGWPPSP